MPRSIRPTLTRRNDSLETVDSRVSRALSHFPRGQYVLASAFEGDRGGTLVEWVHQCCSAPPMIAVSVRKGHAIEQLIRDSGSFSLTDISASSQLVRRTFSISRIPDEDTNQFDALPHKTLSTGAPVLLHCNFAVDCIMTRHIDLEDEYEMYIGRVVDAIALSRLPISVREMRSKE